MTVQIKQRRPTTRSSRPPLRPVRPGPAPFEPSIDPGTSERFAEYRRHRDRRLRDSLVEDHMRLAYHLARRFEGRGESLDDLVQVASLGLVKAVERFEPERGWAFTTFAVPTILGELKRHFRDKTWAVRVPRRLQDVHLRLSGAVDDLTNTLGRSPTVDELAAHMQVTAEDVLEGMEAGAAYRCASLDALTTSPQGEPGRGIVARLALEDHAAELIDDHADLHRVLSMLPARDQAVVKMRYFDGLKQSEIGERLGISQMQVSRILRRILDSLRECKGIDGAARAAG